MRSYNIIDVSALIQELVGNFFYVLPGGYMKRLRDTSLLSLKFVKVEKLLSNICRYGYRDTVVL